MRKKLKKKSGIKTVLEIHIQNNLKQYIIVFIFLLIGVVAGIVFVNNASEKQGTEISGYLNQFLSSLKENKTIDKAELLKQSLFDNISLAVILWFVGSTVIGIPIVYGIVAYRGFCLGYAISSALATLSVGKGIIFSIASMLLQNLLFLPCLLALAVSRNKAISIHYERQKKREYQIRDLSSHYFFSFSYCNINSSIFCRSIYIKQFSIIDCEVFISRMQQEKEKKNDSR